MQRTRTRLEEKSPLIAGVIPEPMPPLTDVIPAPSPLPLHQPSMLESDEEFIVNLGRELKHILAVVKRIVRAVFGESNENKLFCGALEDAFLRYGLFLLKAIDTSNDDQFKFLVRIFNYSADQIAEEEGTGNKVLHGLAWFFAFWTYGSDNSKYWFCPKLKALQNANATFSNHDAHVLNVAQVLLGPVRNRLKDQKPQTKGYIPYDPSEADKAQANFDAVIKQALQK